MGKILTGIFIIILSAVTAQAVYAESVGKFTKVEGRVDITRPGSPAEEVNTGTQVFEKDIVRSKSNSKAESLFADGNILKLAQNTRVEISEYINVSGRRSTVLNLSDTMTSEQIEFSGVAGGTHTAGASGSFAGEGAGYVNEKP